MPVDVRINRAALARLTSGSDAARFLARVGAAAAVEARRLANSSEVADSVQWRVDTARGRVYVSAGHPLAMLTEVGSRPHVIEVDGGKVMANPVTGQVYGTRVEHPGTKPAPFLKPSLAAARRVI